MRGELESAWLLFKATLVPCLPLAIVGVAASAVPGAEATARGEAHGLAHGSEWWGVTVASTLLTLICYGAVLRVQWGVAHGARPPLLVALRAATGDLPGLLGLLALLLLPFVPAVMVTAWRGFGLTAALLTLLALVLLLPACAAWPLLAGQAMNPWSALRTSVAVASPHWRALLGIYATLVAAVAVFLLLASILLGMVMNLAGQGQPAAGGLAFSNGVMAVMLSVPVVYAAAVTVTATRALLRRAPANRGAPAPVPGA